MIERERETERDNIIAEYSLLFKRNFFTHHVCVCVLLFFFQRPFATDTLKPVKLTCILSSFLLGDKILKRIETQLINYANDINKID